LKITLVTPVPVTSLSGNRTTAVRWQRLLEELGHSTDVVQSWQGDEAEVLIALHARKSFDSIRRFHEVRPEAPLVVTLTGTDLYCDLDRSDDVLRAVDMATRVVALQPVALARLPRAVHDKVHVILQSAESASSPPKTSPDRFEVSLLSHLREVKDPLLAAAATRRLPATSRIVVRHAGAALDEDLGEWARKETETNPRYRWLGPLPFDQSRELLASSRLMVLSSREEGGANVVSEAIVDGVPVLSTDIAGSRGLLGDDYPGYYPVGDDEGLASLLLRAESEPEYLAELTEHCVRLRPRFTPEGEREAWRELLASVHQPRSRDQPPEDSQRHHPGR
jgi:putative glycosyltransferase (TIGR04348 family)